MSQVLEQQLSVFLDGELPAEELDLLLGHLDRDAAQRLKLARYAMIGECVRSGVASPAALSVAERVRTALLADMTPVVARPRSAPVNRWGWLAGGVAAAAAVAAFLVANTEMPGLANGPAVRQDNTVRQLTEEPLSSITAAANHRLNPRAAARLTGYLVAHGQYTNQLSRSTFDSHLVTARAERASWRQPQDLASVQ